MSNLNHNSSYNDEVAALKITPHSVEAEQAVLGILLSDNNTWDSIVDVLSEDDFYRYDNRLIYAQIMKLIESQRPADPLTVFESFNNPEEVGGMVYISNLLQNMPTLGYIRQYADIIRNKSILRKLISASNEIIASAYEANHNNIKQVLDAAEAKIFAINETQSRTQQGFLDFKTLVHNALDRIQDMRENTNDSDCTGIPSGFIDIDKQLSGLQQGDLIIVAGRPSMGKTAFALNIAENIAFNGENAMPVIIFSMEMSASQLVMRTLGSTAEINQQRLRVGKLADDEWPRLAHTISVLSDKEVYIDETPALSPMELRARARRLARNGQIGCIIVDYLQLMSGNSSSKSENRATELSEISRSLKTLAKELNCPVIALSQLNRGLEQRPNKRPVMSDLRESGAIEQDADVILFIYRDEVYNPESQHKGTAEIIIGKQRNGPIGTVRLTFHGQFTKFVNYANGEAYFNND
jgi:replicative DNA helicase